MIKELKKMGSLKDEAALYLKNFTLKVNNEVKLENISLDVKRGQVALIYGTRGSGKSLLLRAFLHLNEEIFEVVQGEGEICFFGKSVLDIERKLLRKEIAYVDTSFLNAISFFSLHEFMRLLKGDHFVIEDLSDEELDLLKVLEIDDLLIGDPNVPLGVFQPFQRLALLIYSTLVRNPRVIILDSVLDHLDDEVCTRVKNLLIDSKGDRTILLSSRYVFRFLDVADLLIYLKSGKILYAGSTEEFVKGSHSSF
ncbi:ATP-binding cassette domain-containing protein [Kosmotoga sp. DU53]|uniref:ATP-binding cassette domain-containing protein n=1 Tax=Kosmotoga sp. DU53 TaxID=1310160 RepID=UPI0009EEF546|nr:ABC transporter ATP-binding protein [Kosmotoga sp. DU53]